MEDLLDLYAEPYDPRRPVVCFDETSTAGRGHSRRREDFVRCRHWNTFDLSVFLKSSV